MTIGLYDIVQGISPPPGGTTKLARVVARSNISGLTGLPTIDSVALAAGDRVLLTAQSTASQNGLWTTTGSGTAWERSNDASDGYMLRSGTLVLVSEGTSYTGTFWQLQTTGAITVGTTSLTFTQVAVSGGGVSDGDKGDITVSGSGTVWTIDAGAVTLAKMADMADDRLLGRSAGSAGAPQEVSVSSPLDLNAGALTLPAANSLDNVARVTVRKNTGADVGARRRLNLIEGANVTLTVADDAANEEVDVTIAAAAGGSGASGRTSVSFGSFPGSVEATATITDAAITSTSKVTAWLQSGSGAPGEESDDAHAIASSLVDVICYAVAGGSGGSCTVRVQCRHQGGERLEAPGIGRSQRAGGAVGFNILQQPTVVGSVGGTDLSRLTGTYGICYQVL